MKKLPFKFILLTFIGLVLLGSCNQNEEIIQEEIAPQLDIHNPPLVGCCAECGTSCVLGYEFSSNITDADHVQGGYLVKRIIGDCNCEYANGQWNIVSTGPVTLESVITGGPGGGAACNMSIGQLYWFLFGDNCGMSWSGIPSGGNDGSPFGEWGEWTTDILDSLQGSNHPSGSSPFGVIGIPPAWQIGVSETKKDVISVTLGIPEQVSQIRKLAVFPSGSSSAVISKTADGSKTYELDMKGLPDGTYDLKIVFWPGFYVVETLHKTSPR